MELIFGQLWLVMSGIIFCSTFIQVLTGFGFGLLAVPLLLFVLPSQQALLAGMVLSIMASFLQGFKMRKLARWDLILRLLCLSIPGLILGIALSGYMNKLFIKGVVGAILIAYVFWQWIQIRGSNKDSAKDNTKESAEDGTKVSDLAAATANAEQGLNNKDEDQGPKAGSKEFILAAFSSGLLNGLAAIPGPPIVALLIKYLAKDTFQATTVNFFFLQYAITAAAKLFFYRDTFSISFGILLLSMVFAIILGYLVGQPVSRRINEAQFKKLVYGLLLVIGITSLGEPIIALFK